MGEALAAIGYALGSAQAAAGASGAAVTAANTAATTLGGTAVSGATAAAGTAANIQQGHQAAKAGQKAADLQSGQEELKARNARLKQLRQARIKSASIEAMAGNTGTSQSSGLAGGLSHVGSQTASNISNINTGMSIAKDIGHQGARSARAQEQGSIFGAVGGLGKQAFSDLGGFETIFGRR